MSRPDAGVTRRIGVLLLGLAGAVVLALGLVAGGAAVFLYWHDGHAQSFERHQADVVRHYADEYHKCVRQQRGTQAWCSERSFRHCARDPWWRVQYGGLGAVSEISENCDDADG